MESFTTKLHTIRQELANAYILVYYTGVVLDGGDVDGITKDIRAYLHWS